MDVESENSLVASRSCKKAKCCSIFQIITSTLLITALGTGFSLLCYDKFRIKEIGKQKVFFFKSSKLCFKPEVFYML